MFLSKGRRVIYHFNLTTPCDRESNVTGVTLVPQEHRPGWNRKAAQLASYSAPTREVREKTAHVFTVMNLYFNWKL